LERRQDVQDRISYLRREDDDLVRRKRQQIEASLLTLVNADVSDYATIEGGKIVRFDWDRIRESGLSQMLCEIADSSIGPIPKLKVADKLNALAQLRDLHGFRAPTKIAPTSPDGVGPARIIVQWGGMAAASDEVEPDRQASGGRSNALLSRSNKT
jgi:hypothetical protein